MFPLDADDLAKQIATQVFGSAPETDLVISVSGLTALLKTAIKVTTAYSQVWSLEWPTEPGLYLFYCRTKTRKGSKPSERKYIWSVEAVRAGGELTPHMLYSGGGMILYPQEWEGVWQPLPLPLEMPDLDKMLGEVPP